MARVEHRPVWRLRRWPVTAVPTTGFEDKWPLGTGSNAQGQVLIRTELDLITTTDDSSDL